MVLARRAAAHDQRHAALDLKLVRTIISNPDLGPASVPPSLRANRRVRPQTSPKAVFMLGPMEMQRKVNTQNDK